MSITPQPPGKFRWLGTQMIAFEAEGRVPFSTTYTATVEAGETSTIGSKLGKRVQWRRGGSTARPGRGGGGSRPGACACGRSRTARPRVRPGYTRPSARGRARGRPRHGALAGAARTGRARPGTPCAAWARAPRNRRRRSGGRRRRRRRRPRSGRRWRARSRGRGSRRGTSARAGGRGPPGRRARRRQRRARRVPPGAWIGLGTQKFGRHGCASAASAAIYHESSRRDDRSMRRATRRCRSES